MRSDTILLQRILKDMQQFHEKNEVVQIKI